MKKLVRILCVASLAATALFSVTSFASADEVCKASWYGPGFHGRTMANGKRFDQNKADIVAHKTLPFGTWIRVTDIATGRSIKLKVQDRGPYIKGRCVDLSKAAATKLGFIGKGTTKVRVERL